MTIDYASAGRLLDDFGRAWAEFDGDAWVGLFTEDARYHGDPFGPPLDGHNALRAFLVESAETQEDVEFTVERHWVVGTPSSRRGTPAIAARGHPSSCGSRASTRWTSRRITGSSVCTDGGWSARPMRRTRKDAARWLETSPSTS